MLTASHGCGLQLLYRWRPRHTDTDSRLGGPARPVAVSRGGRRLTNLVIAASIESGELDRVAAAMQSGDDAIGYPKGRFTRDMSAF